MSWYQKTTVFYSGLLSDTFEVNVERLAGQIRLPEGKPAGILGLPCLSNLSSAPPPQSPDTPCSGTLGMTEGSGGSSADMPQVALPMVLGFLLTSGTFSSWLHPGNKRQQKWDSFSRFQPWIGNPAPESSWWEGAKWLSSDSRQPPTLQQKINKLTLP